MKCFYHKADLDGLCSAAIVKHFFRDCECIPFNYGEPFPWETVNAEEKVVMVDISLPLADMAKLGDLCDLTWIDHHKTIIEEAGKLDEPIRGKCVLQVGQAACELTWMEFCSRGGYTDGIVLPVWLLGRYDVWDLFASDDVLPFQFGMRIEDAEPGAPIWKKLFSGECWPEVARIVRNGKTILEYRKKEDERYYKAAAFRTEIDGRKAIVINRGLANSQAFDYGQAFDDDLADVKIAFYRHPLFDKNGYVGNAWRVSLYSTKIDVGELAKKFGGGGHKGAAGFVCEELPFEI